MAVNAAESAYQIMPIGFWAVAETSTVSDSLRQACQSTFEEWQDTIADGFISNGFEEGKAKELSMVIMSLLEGAIIISTTQKDSKPLLAVAEYIPVLLQR